MASTIVTSVITGGSNSHQTVAEELNAYATDFVTQGVVGAITSGPPQTGSFGLTQDSSPDMGVTVLAGQAYVAGTPSGQDAQVVRARMTANYTSYTIATNSSGTTKYDWIYLQFNAANASTPSSAADNVVTLYTSRSSSNSSDNGSPPTFGLLLGIVTVANGASSIVNGNISDSRANSTIGSQGGSLIVTPQSIGQDAIIEVSGAAANINLDLNSKGSGVVKANGNPIWQYLGYVEKTSNNAQNGDTLQAISALTLTVTIPTGSTMTRVSAFFPGLANDASGIQATYVSIWDGTVGSGTQIQQGNTAQPATSYGSSLGISRVITPAAGSKTYNVGLQSSTGNPTAAGSTTAPMWLLVECC